MGVSICHPGALGTASAGSPSAGTTELVWTPLCHSAPAPGGGRLAKVPAMRATVFTFTVLVQSFPFPPPPGDPHLLSHQTDISSVYSGPRRTDPSDHHTSWRSMVDPGRIPQCCCLYCHEKGTTFVVFLVFSCLLHFLHAVTAVEMKRKHVS